MNGGLRFAAPASETQEAEDARRHAPAPEAEPRMTAEFEQEEDEDASPGRLLRLAPLVFALAGIAWLAWSIAGTRAALAVAAPVERIELIAALCVPLALLALLYLLLLRTSRAEARRFGATARAMRAESRHLERMVGSLARTIEENRRALATQTNELLATGNSAAERLQAISNGMAGEARTIEMCAQTLDRASQDAERRVAIVSASLPKAHEEMKSLSETLDHAGLTAGERAAALEAQLVLLAERGREADTVASGAAQRLAAHIARMEATSETAGARLELAASEMTSAVDAVLDRAAHAVDEARKGIATQGDAMLAMLSTNQAALDRAGRDSLEAMAERIKAIESTLERVGERLAEERDRGETLFSTLEQGAASADQRFAELAESGAERARGLSGSLEALTNSAEAMNTVLDRGEERARTVIATAEELLVALDAGAREIDETLPQALARLDARIAESRHVIGTAKPELLALVTAAEGTHDAVEAIADVVAKQRETLARSSGSLAEALDGGLTKARTIEETVDSTIHRAKRFAEDAAPDLLAAMERMRESAADAAEQAREALTSFIPEAAAALENRGAEAMQRAMDATVRRELEQLQQVADDAVRAATTASEQLTHQMLGIAETTGTVEARIEEARAEREAAEKDSFARRVSLLIEALNSAAIDVTKIFAQEVPDSSWAAYLKGDRGVFTRRAVRLVDTADAREIARLYENDDAAREQINRYIHDFEAMLRQVLVLRDGSPFGVTLLSSDMGKLYVALAQAIERLRT